MDKQQNDALFKKMIIPAVILFLAAVVCVVFAVRAGKSKRAGSPVTEEYSALYNTAAPSTYYRPEPRSDNWSKQTITPNTTTTRAATTASPAPATQAATAAPPASSGSGATLIDFPADTASWQMILLNKRYRVDSQADKTINLVYVAGSGELMDERAAVWYDKMYAAAKEDGISLWPCSGYRSYDEQVELFDEFVYDYMNEGYGREEAEELASRRRMPAGSSEHNIGICMDIICADSSVHFENTEAYAWLSANAANYGFILRYPENKVDITGVKFEPWHWRFVGVENAAAIRDSGLCLEEYLNKVG